MTRDSDRIDDVLDALEEYWREYPDLRLGQIVSNASVDKRSNADPFNMEDDELLEHLEERIGRC